MIATVNGRVRRSGGPYRCCEHCIEDPGFHEGPESVNTHTVTCSTAGSVCARGDSQVSIAVAVYCAHDMSLTGAEGPVRDLGRWPILWSCDWCGATLLQADEESS